MSRPWWSMQPPPVPPETELYPPGHAQEQHRPHGDGNGSVGTLVVVLAVITILGVLAGVIARVCGGRHLTGGGDYDFEGWVEDKCSSCIDGSVAPPPKAPEATPPPPEDDSKDKDADKPAVS